MIDWKSYKENFVPQVLKDALPDAEFMPHPGQPTVIECRFPSLVFFNLQELRIVNGKKATIELIAARVAAVILQRADGE